MVYVFFADGFEEIEALAPVDILRRAEIDVKIVKAGKIRAVSRIIEMIEPQNMFAESPRDIRIICDINIDKIDLKNAEMIILPGGAGGVENLYNCESVKKIIGHCVENNIKIGAICAAPSILARLGYLKGRKAAAYPSFRHYLTDNGAVVAEEKVITDGLFTTAAGAGVSIEFALELVSVLRGAELARKIGEQILFY